MAGGWGSRKNGVRIGAFWDDLQISSDGSQARITGAVIKIDRDARIADSKNSLSWSGGAVSDGSDSDINVSGSGSKTIKSVTGQWQTLDYGATKSASFAASMSGVSGGTVTVSKSVPYPARKYNVPAAPTGLVAAMASDTTQNLAWSRTSTTDAPWQGTYLERRDNVNTAWQVIAGITGNNALATTYSDTTTQPDRLYEYRLRGWNSSGYGAYGISGFAGTTPLPATSVLAAKNTSGGITITFDNPSTISDGFRVSRSDDGGAYAVVAMVNAAGATTWTDAAPSLLQTHAYKVEMSTGRGTRFSALSPASNTVQLLTAPNAPTGLSNGWVTVRDAATVIPFIWVHIPKDSSAQTAYQLRYRTSTDGGTTWSAYTELAKVTSTSGWNAPANTLANGRRLEWQVRTWGLYADPSPYSGSQPLKLSAAPTGTLTAPPATLTLGRVTPAWTYYDPEGMAQGAFQTRLRNMDAAEDLGSWTVNSAATSYEIPVDLANATRYRVYLSVRDGDGLWSNGVYRDFVTDFPPPPKPSLDLGWDADRGAIIVQATNPAPRGGQPSAFVNQIERSDDDGASWARISTLEPNGTFSDPIPATGVTNRYRALAVSAMPSQIYSDVTEIEPDPEVLRWAWFNSGPSFSVVARARANPALDETFQRTRVVHVFDGREYGVEYNGSTRAHEFSYKGEMETDHVFSTEADFRAVADAVGPSAYRDPWYRWPVSYGGLSIGREVTPTVRKVSLDFARVDSYGDS